MWYDIIRKHKSRKKKETYHTQDINTYRAKSARTYIGESHYKTFQIHDGYKVYKNNNHKESKYKYTHTNSIANK